MSRSENEKTTRIERNNIGTIANSLQGILPYEEIYLANIPPGSQSQNPP